MSKNEVLDLLKENNEIEKKEESAEEPVEDFSDWLQTQQFDLHSVKTRDDYYGANGVLPRDENQQVHFIPAAVHTRIQQNKLKSWRRFHSIEQKLNDNYENSLLGSSHCEQIVSQMAKARPAKLGFWSKFVSKKTKLLESSEHFLTQTKRVFAIQPRPFILDYNLHEEPNPSSPLKPSRDQNIIEQIEWNPEQVSDEKEASFSQEEEIKVTLQSPEEQKDQIHNSASALAPFSFSSLIWTLHRFIRSLIPFPTSKIRQLANKR